MYRAPVVRFVEMLRLFQRVTYLTKISQEPVWRVAGKVLHKSIALTSTNEESNEDEQTVHQRPDENSPNYEP